MQVFSSKSTVEVWGPTASVDVRIKSLGSFINNTWLLTNLQVEAREIVDVRQCFNEVSYIYALGNDQSQCAMVLTFAILIGRKNCGGASNLKALKEGIDAYVDARISRKTKPTTITIGDFSRKGWVTGIDIGSLDPSRGICYGTINFIMELKK